MNTLMHDRYGTLDVLRFHEAATPRPAAGEVLVRVHAAAVNRSDMMAVAGSPFLMRLAGGGLLRPRNQIPGADVAGIVEAVGTGVARFRAGDAVFGDLSGRGRGGFAECVAAPEELLAAVPPGLALETAAALPTAGVTALQALRDVARVRPGESVLIEGASGGVGTFAIQIARALGARVTAVVGPRNVDLARRLGADAVIDYTRRDLADAGADHDVIYAVNGHHRPAEYRALFSETGRFVMTGGTGPLMMQTMLGGSRFSFHIMKPNRADLEAIAALTASGAVTPVIERVVGFDGAIEALRTVAGGHAQGKVIISMNAARTAASHTHS